MMELVEVATEIVAPAVRAIFRDGEVEALELQRSDDLGGSVELTITARGESFRYLVVQGNVLDMSAQDWSDNLRSLLFDFVAESRFGWGQQRDLG